MNIKTITVIEIIKGIPSQIISFSFINKQQAIKEAEELFMRLAIQNRYDSAIHEKIELNGSSDNSWDDGNGYELYLKESNIIKL